MEKRGRVASGALLVLALSMVLLSPCASQADPGNNYCVTPAFVSGNIPPNLMLMIDNSASMYDLEFVDQGKKHCSVTTGTPCTLNSDCPSGETCSVFDREPYYCYDQSYTDVKSDGATPNIYNGYFLTKDGLGNDVYYYYDKSSDSFLQTTSAFPAGCGTHAGTVTKMDANSNTVCVEYNNTSSPRALVSFVAKGSYLNWLTASKFDIEKQIFTGGKFVSGLCSSDSNRACASAADCISGDTCNAVASGSTFMLPESRGCVGQRFLKDAITSDRFVNYNTGSTNPNTQLGVTFSVRGPLNPYNETAPSWGGQTYIDLFASATGAPYNSAACQLAVQTITNVNSSNAAVKQTVAACLSGAQGGTCSNPPTGTTVNCFATYPDCYQPGRCSGNTSITCLSSADCGTSGTCNYSYYCEGPNGTVTNLTCNTPGTTTTQCPTGSYMCDEGNASPYNSPKTPTVSCLASEQDKATPVTGGSCSATYWCDWGTDAGWMSSAAAPTGYTCYAPSSNDPTCAVQSTQQGKCSLKQNQSCNTDSDCSKNGNGVCQGYKANGNHACVQHTPAHGTCRYINGATTGICGGIKDYGICQFGASDNPTKQKVSFQQSMQTCWQYNKFVQGVGGQDVGIDDIKTGVSQCSSLYNGQGSAPPYQTCSNNPLTTCSSSTDCGGNACDSGPSAIAAGNSAYICGVNYLGGIFFLNKTGSWVQDGSFNDSVTGMQDLKTDTGVNVSVPGACLGTDTFRTCATKIYRAFCASTTSPGVTDPSDSPSDTSMYDNVPAILSGVAVQSQLGSPIATMRVRPMRATPACTKDTDCTTGNTCIGGVCKPSGLIQKFGSLIRMGAMDFDPYGASSEVSPTLAAVLPAKTCSNDPTQNCTANIDCGTGNTCVAATNLDGGRVIYPIGLGKCANMNSTPCASNADCSGAGGTCYNGVCGLLTSTDCTTALTCTGTAPVCIRNPPGDHSTPNSLVQVIDGIRAQTWTPLAEAFYNLLGYFAAIPQSDGSFKSRVSGVSTSPLRINSLRTTSTDITSFANAAVDFNESLHPSEYRCQQNYAMLITDGSSTADRNTSMTGLASVYASQAGTTAGNCPVATGGIDYGGTSDLPIMSWIGRRQNLATFSTSTATQLYCSATTTQTCASDSDCPSGESCQNGANPRDYVTSYVVLNGADNGTNGICDAATLLGKAASNGGTTLKQANDPPKLITALTSIFENIAAKASSGTAASILSNSEGSGANVLQAVFYPKKVFDSQTSTNWIGEMQNLWYYIDPQISNSTIREDTNSDLALDLKQDNVVRLAFDPVDNTTYAYVSTDLNGDGLGDTTEVKENADLVKSIWRAGKQLWSRDLLTSPRTIYTPLLPSGTQVGTTGLMTFTYGPIGSTNFVDNSAVLQPYLQLTDSASTVKLMQYVHGFDFPADTTMRSRTVQIGSLPAASLTDPLYASNPQDHGIGVWKLGDIISSTPRIQSTVRQNGYGLSSPAGYNDVSYLSYVSSNNYQNRGMAYVGANDGMLHAFNLGKLDVTASQYTKAHLIGSNLGKEQWAYIPKHVLPYLKYASDPAYNHLYYVDGSTVLNDISIGDLGTPACNSSNYDTCVKQPVVVVDSTFNKNLDPAKNTWRSILISSMGIGGATTNKCPATTGGDSNCVQTPTTDPANSANGLGYSSYSALDVTDPSNPVLLWEFTNPALGYATTGPAIVRVGDASVNGKWFAVFGSGPTGPIDTSNHQFLGRSNQTLKFFVVEIKTGTLVTTIDTGIANAFAGSMTAGPIDADRWTGGTSQLVNGFYQDDAIYVGYTKKSSTTGAWTDGGVLRIVTNESTTPASTVAGKGWTWSTVIDGVGPVTNSISRLQDRQNHVLWLYFGTGRYYSRSGNTIDDFTTQRAIYGVKEPCYNTNSLPGDRLDKSCMNKQDSTSQVSPSSLTDQTSTITAVLNNGWKVSLDPSTSSYGAERVVTDAVALTNGAVYVTSFEPTADPCGYGGNSFLWALDYKTGARPTDSVLAGKALIQLSTGEFKQVDLAQAFGTGSTRLNRRANIQMTGKPPSDAFPVVSNSGNKPIKRILHIQEK